MNLQTIHGNCLEELRRLTGDDVKALAKKILGEIIKQAREQLSW